MMSAEQKVSKGEAMESNVGRRLADQSGESVAQQSLSAIVSASTNARHLDPSDNMARGETQESMAEPELLALIIELRLRASDRPSGKDGRSGSGSGGGGSKESSAVDTLDLCHRKIEKLPYEMVNIIKDDVVRLALGYNFITSLPSTFADLSRLRYLNVRANLMSSFPTVLCTLPSLEILDISRNKIRKLPSDPGRLLDLRVLSISNNRLRKLPVWLHRLKHLRILKLEGNPIAWPPPHVSSMPPLDKAAVMDKAGVQLSMEGETDKEAAMAARKKAEDRHMALWISKLKVWIEENKERNKMEQDGATAGEDAGIQGYVITSPSEQHALDQTESTSSAPMIAAEPQGEGILHGGGDHEKEEESYAQTPGESKRSIGATFLSIDNDATTDEERDKPDEVIALPIARPLEALLQEGSERSISDMKQEGKDGVEGETPNAHETRGKAAEQSDAMQMATEAEASNVLDPSTSTAVQQVKLLNDWEVGGAASTSTSARHTEGLTSTVPVDAPPLGTGMGAGLRRGLRNKKSLPDLRQSHSAILAERRENVSSNLAPPDDSSSPSQRQRRPSANLSRRPPLPHANSESVGMSASRNDLSRLMNGDDFRRGQGEGTALSDAGGSSSGGNKSAVSVGFADIQAASSSTGAVEVERNSYFKRLSTLPASTISNSISIPVLQCVDATRGILYALSQMHTALKQYITFATDERMTSQLSRALEIASTSMAVFINSLDRFDSLSRIKGGTLNPMIVRGVLVSCSESVMCFRKVVSVLQLQLKTLQAGADIRYTRTLLLLLYGSLAEVGNSWKVMAPLFADVIPYLQGLDANSTPTLATAGIANPYTLPSIAEASSPISPNSARVNGSTGTTNRPMRRRHAGSFSAHDVAQGAFIMPSEPLPTQVVEDGVRRAQRPAALGPISGSTRSAAYQIQQGDQEGGRLDEEKQSNKFALPAEAHTPRDRGRMAEESSSSTGRRTLSNTSVGAGQNISTPIATPFSASFAIDGGRTMVDDHLILLLVRIASVAFIVWASIDDHLNLLGVAVDGKGSTSAATSSSLHTYVTPDSTPALDSDAFDASPHTPARSARPVDFSSSSSATVVQDPGEEFMSPASSTGRGVLQQQQQQQQHNLTPSSLNKLRQLREVTNRLVEQTHRLEACREKVQERSGPRSPPPSTALIASSNEAFRELYAESSAFIKAILHVSHFLKSLSLEHQLPKSIKSNLAQLTTCARDLTLHLHFLGGPPPSSQPALSASTQQTFSPVQPIRQAED